VVVSAHASPSDRNPAFLPVEPRHRQFVAGQKPVDQSAKLGAVGLCSADMQVADNLLVSGLGQLPRLGVNALALAARGYPCIPVFHAAIMQLIYAAKKLNLFSVLFLLRNS
jgi:hypothetical protein